METSPDRPPPPAPTGPPPDRPVDARPATHPSTRTPAPGGTGVGPGSWPADRADRRRRRPGRRRRAPARHALAPPPGLIAVITSPEQPARRRTTLVALGVVAAASAAALVAGLLSWGPAAGEPARALTQGEAERLAATRVTNYRDVRAGVRVTVGAGATRTDLVGWVDWARPLAYLDVGGPGAGVDRGLVQATHSVVVVRPDPAAVPTPAPPPLVPPTDRWRLRDLPADRPLAGVLDLLFGLSADRAEPADPLRRGAGRWVGRETLAGEPVDVLQAPLPGPTAADPTASPPAPPAAADGDPRWWVDRDARLRRWEGRLPGGQAVAVELQRGNRPTIWPVDALGGRPGLPRALTDAEADRLAQVPARLRAQPGAAVTVAVPLGTAANLRGSGWLSWSGGAAYLSVAELDTLGRRTLLRHDRGGFARAEVPVGPGTDGAGAPTGPPLPPPAGAGWRTGARPLDDLDLLVDAALRADTTPARPRAAVRLRADRVAGRVVDVVELRAQGLRLRYWLDRTGLPRRLELRTRAGAWAQLDLAPGPVPAGIVPPRPGPPTRKAPAARAGTAGRR
ncbi:hypothetical protein [Micromonospora sp. NPDC050200]|uniref:hypothetical protein n=1 Tax=Micromonospora sp. NPDC050200 TaxID=3155664 RepID=UPI00340AA86C